MLGASTARSKTSPHLSTLLRRQVDCSRALVVLRALPGTTMQLHKHLVRYNHTQPVLQAKNPARVDPLVSLVHHNGDSNYLRAWHHCTQTFTRMGTDQIFTGTPRRGDTPKCMASPHSNLHAHGNRPWSHRYTEMSRHHRKHGITACKSSYVCEQTLRSHEKGNIVGFSRA
jgi:hypothetical protein